jgi:hypothetical protein
VTPDERAAHLISGEAWSDFCRRLDAIGAQILRPDVPGTPLDRAEGYRHLTRTLVAALQQIVEFGDVERPLFYQNPAAPVKWGGDNPDNLYLHAAIDGAAHYRIRGQRGSVHDFILSTSAAGPMEAAASGPHKNRSHRVFAELCARDLEIEADGSFEILVAPERQPGNWLPSHPDVGFVLIRQYFYDWEREENARFEIERVGCEGLAPPPLEPARMAEMLDDAMAWVERLPYWTKLIQRSFAVAGPNGLQHQGAVRGGASDIFYGQGFFELADDQALLIELEPPDARYWQFGLCSHWFETLDYANHQSSLNGQQIRLDPDGVARLVIAPRDPGFANWLDTAGHARGLIQYRYVWSLSNPEPRARVVPHAELPAELPPDAPRVTPAQRRAAIRTRQRHVARRHRWG